MASDSGRTPSIEPDDHSIVTPDIDEKALAPAPVATGSPPSAAKLTNLLGENADARHIALIGLFLLAVLYTLHLAKAFFLPIVLAILLDFLLSPVIRALRKIRIPEPIGAGIVVLGLLAVLVIGVYRLSGPASEYIALAPESIETVQRKLQSMRGSVAQVTDVAERVERAAAGIAGDAQQVEIKGPSLARQIFGGTTAFLSAATVVIFLTYFLLAVGDLFLQKLVGVLPQFKDKRTAVTIARETEAQISRARGLRHLRGHRPRTPGARHLPGAQPDREQPRHPDDLRQSDAAQYGRALHRPGFLVVHLGRSRRDSRGADDGGDQDRLRPYRAPRADRGVSRQVRRGNGMRRE